MSIPFKNITGKRFGRWTAIHLILPRGKDTRWFCLCDCGAGAVVHMETLGKRSTSCGCLRRELVSKRRLIHGRTATVEYRSWSGAKYRCYNKKNPVFNRYGGRGIRMADSWKNDFSQFYKDMGPCPPKYTLERIDVNGDYSPENCKWETMKQQQRNRRNTRRLVFGGKNTTLATIAEKANINLTRLAYHHETQGEINKAICHIRELDSRIAS